MSLPDPNAAAPAPQPAEVIATTDEIEKKRIELKSMLSGCIASGKLQISRISRVSRISRFHVSRISTESSGSKSKIFEIGLNQS